MKNMLLQTKNKNIWKIIKTISIEEINNLYYGIAINNNQKYFITIGYIQKEIVENLINQLLTNGTLLKEIEIEI